MNGATTDLTITWLGSGLDPNAGDGDWVLAIDLDDNPDVRLTFKQMEALDRPLFRLTK